MIRVLGYLVVNILVLIVLSALIPNFTVSGLWPAFWYVVILTFLNWTIVPVIRLLALPINFITFGLINGIINVVTIIVTVQLTEGILIEGEFWTQILIAIIISIGMALGQGLVNKLTDDE